jgi:flagellar basal body-associated protein FliL
MEVDEIINEKKNKKEKKSRKGLVITLIIILVILLGICAYLFLVKPYLENLVKDSAQYGIQYAIYTIMNEAGQCKEVPLTIGNNTLTLIAKECLN